MKKVSKSIAVVMALIMALSTFALTAFAADEAYSIPEGKFTLAGGTSKDDAKVVAIGETVYGTVAQGETVCYQISSSAAQNIDFALESSAAVDVTISNYAATVLTSLVGLCKYDQTVSLSENSYYITITNHVEEAPEEDTTETPDANEGVETADAEEVAPATEFTFSTSTENMEEIYVVINKSTATLVAGESLRLELSDWTVSDINYYWRVVDNKETELDERTIATVSQNGTVTILPNFTKETEVKVQAVVYYNGAERTKSCTITAVPANIFLTPYYGTTEDNCLTLGLGAVRYIKAETNVKDATVQWSSNNEDIVTVSPAGKVTAQDIGTATITASVICGDKVIKRSILVVVDQNHVSVKDITFVEHSAKIRQNESDTLEYTIETTPENGVPTNRKVIFTSSDPSVATVDADGKVTGVSVGTATITVTTDDGSFTDSCVVTITDPIPNWLMLIVAPLRLIYNFILMIIGK